MPGSVLLAGARTPIGKLSGAFAGFSGMDLGGFAIAAALERAIRRAAPDDAVFATGSLYLVEDYRRGWANLHAARDSSPTPRKSSR